LDLVYSLLRLEAELPPRPFNNFHFIRHAAILDHAATEGFSAEKTDAFLATDALLLLPDQYEASASLGYLGDQKKRYVAVTQGH
jgi:hypothetical protein